MMMNGSNNIECTMETIAAMCLQEKNYITSDYMNRSLNGPLHERTTTDDEIDVDCRTKMTAWCYRVVDFCGFSRETVAIAMNILDRFMASLSPAAMQAKKNRRTYQLACMTSLYTAVKVHEPEVMNCAMLAKISHGTYTEEEIENMEFQLLPAVSWRVNNPTALSFVNQYLEVMSSNYDMDASTRDMIYELAKLQTELAVPEYDFLSVKASVIAYCSLMNATNIVATNAATSNPGMWVRLAKTIALQQNDAQLVASVQNCLYASILEQPIAQSIILRRSGIDEHRLFKYHGIPGNKTVSEYSNNNNNNTPVNSPRSVSGKYSYENGNS